MIKRYVLIGLLIMSCLGSNFNQAGLFDVFRGWWNMPSNLERGEWAEFLGIYDNACLYAINCANDGYYDYVGRLILHPFSGKKEQGKVFFLHPGDSLFIKWIRWSNENTSARGSLSPELLAKKFETYRSYLYDSVKDVCYDSVGSMCYLLFKYPVAYRFMLFPVDYYKNINNSQIFSEYEKPFIEIFDRSVVSTVKDSDMWEEREPHISYRLVKKLNLKTGECENIAFKDLPEIVRKRFSR